VRAAIIENGAVLVRETADPEPSEGELLLRIRAAGINGADLAQRAGRYPPPPGAPDVPGLECAGETDDGRRVMALLGGGGHAEAVAVDARHVVDVPDDVGWAQAGGFMETFCTAHDALFTQAPLRPGERLLVNGAAGGVGTAAVQLGVAAGAEVTGTARRNADRVAELGASTEPRGEYDVILELVGGDNLATNVERLALNGRIVVIGTGAGSRAQVEFGQLMRRRGRIFSSTLRARSAEEKALVVERVRDEVVPLLVGGTITVPVHATYPLEQAQQAYDDFRAGGKFGKLVLLPTR
jgi:NADPH:quinone reductase-like Zn-dependent oxidoreductase